MAAKKAKPKKSKSVTEPRDSGAKVKMRTKFSSPKPIEPPIYKTRIKIIGIGGGGSSIVSEIASKVKKVGFVVANTDIQLLKKQ